MADVYEFPARRDGPVAVSCAEVEEEHAAYVWGGLEPAERDRVDAHRGQCPACDARLLASERVVSELDQAHPRMAPPAELRARVLEAIASSVPSPDTRVRPRALLSAADGPVHGFAAPDQPTLLAAHRSRRRPGPFLTGLATGLAGAAAAAALVVVLLVRPEALGLLGARQAQFGSSDEAPLAPGISFPWQAPASSSSSRLLELRSTSAPGRGLLAFDGQTRRGVLLLEGVAPTEGTEYAVWLIQGSSRVQLGSLSVDTSGSGSFVLPEPLPLDRPERIEIAPSAPPAGAADGTLSAAF